MSEEHVLGQTWREERERRDVDYSEALHTEHSTVRVNDSHCVVWLAHFTCQAENDQYCCCRARWFNHEDVMELGNTHMCMKHEIDTLHHL